MVDDFRLDGKENSPAGVFFCFDQTQKNSFDVIVHVSKINNSHQQKAAVCKNSWIID